MLPAAFRRRRVIIESSDSEADSSSIQPPGAARGHALDTPAQSAADVEQPGTGTHNDEKEPASIPNSIHLTQPQHDALSVANNPPITVTVTIVSDDSDCDADVSSDSGSSGSNDPISRTSRKLPLRSVSLPQHTVRKAASTEDATLTTLQYAAKYGRFPQKPPIAATTQPPATPLPKLGRPFDQFGETLPRNTADTAVPKEAVVVLQSPAADAKDDQGADLNVTSSNEHLSGVPFLDDDLFLWNARPPATSQYLDLYAAHDGCFSSGSTGSSDGSLSGDFVEHEEPPAETDADLQILMKLFPITYKKQLKGKGGTKPAVAGSAVLPY